MLPRIRPTPFFRRTLYSRSYSTGAPRRGYFIAGTALAATGSGAFYLSNSPGLQSHRGEQDAHGPSLRELARSCVVYAMCSVPALVDAAPTILTKLLAIPGISKVTEGIVRSTFFAQFVGGESVKDAIPLIDRMREQNIGTLLAYSVEVDEHSANQSLGAALTRKDPELAIHRLNVEEMIRSVDEAGDHEDRISHLVRRDSSVGRSTWVAVKLTALLPSHETLEHFSNYLLQTRRSHADIPFPGIPQLDDLDSLREAEGKGLTHEDVVALNQLRDDLTRLCERAQARNVRVIVDAEHSWYQPAIDAFGLYMMSKYNKRRPVDASLSLWKMLSVTQEPSQPPPLVYVTFQAYQRRTEEYLVKSLEAARRDGYALGIKLVRGAYHEQEVNRNSRRSPNRLPPVWMAKSETDHCYNQCASIIIDSLSESIRSGNPGLGVLFGTHNEESADRIIETLASKRLGRSVSEKGLVVGSQLADRVAFAQLYGMRDSMTRDLASRIQSPFPMVYKYVPYGKMVDVMPYLSRRATENKSVLGGSSGAREELRIAAKALRERLTA